MGRRNKYCAQGGREWRKSPYRCTWVSTMMTRTGILTVHFPTLLHLSLRFKRTNCDVYSEDALFESAPRYRLSRRGVIMISISLNTICRGDASNRPRSIPNPFNLLFISYSAIRLHTFQYNESIVSEYRNMLGSMRMYDNGSDAWNVWQVGQVTRESGPGHCDAL